MNAVREQIDYANPTVMGNLRRMAEAGSEYAKQLLAEAERIHEQRHGGGCA